MRIPIRITAVAAALAVVALGGLSPPEARAAPPQVRAANVTHVTTPKKVLIKLELVLVPSEIKGEAPRLVVVRILPMSKELPAGRASPMERSLALLVASKMVMADATYATTRMRPQLATLSRRHADTGSRPGAPSRASPMNPEAHTVIDIIRSQSVNTT